MYNKLSVHFGKDKTKSILFSPKHRSKSIGQTDISYKDSKIKHTQNNTFLPCALDECLTRESIAMQVYTNITSKLDFHIEKAGFTKQMYTFLLAIGQQRTDRN